MTKRSDEPGDLSVLSDLAPTLAEMLVALSSDITLVIDGEGVIRRVALGGAEPIGSATRDWVGRSWADTVSADTRFKIDDMLRDLGTTGVSRPRQVNHISAVGQQIPVAYTAVRLGTGGPVLAMGRDLRAVAMAQQKLVESQQAMERDYWRLRQTETRYRLLFQLAGEAGCVIDGTSLTVLEANRSAGRVFEKSCETLVGLPLEALVAAPSRAALGALLATARQSGRAAEGVVMLESSFGAAKLAVTPYRTDGNLLLLLRVRPSTGESVLSDSPSRLLSLVHHTPDAIVVVDGSGRLLDANPAFFALIQCESAEVTGRPLANWFAAESAGILQTTFEAVRSAGVAGPVTGAMSCGPTRESRPVELTAVLLPEGDGVCIGFVMRPLPPPNPRNGEGAPSLAVH